MAGSYAQGPQAAGNYPTPGRDSGLSVFKQVVDIPAGGQASANFTAYLPDGAQVVDIILDSTTAHTSATATVSAGTTLGGTELASATDVKTAARTRPTFTAAQLAAMQALTHVNGQVDVPIYLRLALTTPTSVGVTKATILYSLQLP